MLFNGISRYFEANFDFLFFMLVLRVGFLSVLFAYVFKTILLPFSEVLPDRSPLLIKLYEDVYCIS